MKTSNFLLILGVLLLFGACDDSSVSSNSNNSNNTNNANNTNNTTCDPVCDTNATCEDLNGTLTCVCAEGFDGDGITCADVDECADSTHNCNTNATCENAEGGFACTCESGYEGDGIVCDDVDECSTGTDNCDANATCLNTPGNFTCICNPPLVGDGTVCVEPTDCTNDPSICHTNATCMDQGAFSICLCDSGYNGDGLSCADIDECDVGTHTCDANATCTNSIGSFDCACDTGFTGDGQSCTDIDECTDGTNNCDANATCTNIDGSFTCTCISGYGGDGISCTDTDECSDGTNNCDSNATCTNSDGSFTCVCNTGFTGDGLGCSDDDECNDGMHNCDIDATCTNIPGGFDCACDSGFSGDGVTCFDIDECIEGMDNCDINATCTNISGGFTCACNSGYNGPGLTCADVDECANGTDNCNMFGNCTNTSGSFTCNCPAFSVDINGDGILCEYYQTCQDLLLHEGGGLPDGEYIIDPDGTASGIDPFAVYCDMTTDGGGWTIVYSATGADGEEPMVSDVKVAGDAFSQHYNLNRAQKMAISELSNYSIFLRNSGEWIKSNHVLFDSSLDTPMRESHYDVEIISSNGTIAMAVMGWSNHSISGGGDYHLSTGPVDHHSSNYYVLNSGCVNQYLYSYSNLVLDGDAGYDSNTGLGDWTASVACESGEGGSLQFYAAMRTETGPAYELTGTPDPYSVYNTVEDTYFFSNNILSGIWHRKSNKIIIGHYNNLGYYSFPAGSSGYSQFPDNDTSTPYDVIVQVPATNTVVHTDQDYNPSTYNRIFVGTIGAYTGYLSNFAVAIYDDGFTGTCYLRSSSASEFLCFDGAAVRHYATKEGTSNLTFVNSVTLTGNTFQYNQSYGGTFAWDGMYYYFAVNGTTNSNPNYEVFNADGSLLGSFTSTMQNMNSLYFDWSVGRYVIHDGYGDAKGGNLYTWAGGTYDNDSQCYSPVSSQHTLK
jgi:EGF domain/Calcium-binding EGF domain/Fibrinogen beta and gamma chains, C-terminal globular domain